MAQQNLSPAQQLARTVERVTDRIRGMRARIAEDVVIRRKREPLTRMELLRFFEVVDDLEEVIRQLDPTLVQPLIDEPDELGTISSSLPCLSCHETMKPDGDGYRCEGCGVFVSNDVLDCDHARLIGSQCADCGRRLDFAAWEPRRDWWIRCGGSLLQGTPGEG